MKMTTTQLSRKYLGLGFWPLAIFANCVKGSPPKRVALLFQRGGLARGRARGARGGSGRAERSLVSLVPPKSLESAHLSFNRRRERRPWGRLKCSSSWSGRGEDARLRTVARLLAQYRLNPVAHNCFDGRDAAPRERRGPSGVAGHGDIVREDDLLASLT